ncbi:divergent polysaccharide deacetylase family protein [Desulfatiglans anilini]|uniref:divergent polysaccharide deacetylase family protein n=1 Tax=Desulfatiglans anilini TaxID=90728 RepID=UPI00042783AF|nr:divergent polysaccharide deacetylase family protein [Desulfatiglans anilini]
MTIGLFLAFLGLVAFSLWVFRDKGFTGDAVRTIPPFEEVVSVPEGFRDAVGEIDRSVYRVLFDSGIGEESVSFERVIPQHRNGIVWDYAELSVRCSNEESARKLAYALAQNADVYDAPKIRGRILSSTGGRMVIEISKDNLRTHLVSLVWGVPEDRKIPRHPKLAIVIDDIGYDRRMADALMSLDFPLSLSILPYGPFSRDALEKCEERGLEVLLHLPMEPKGYPEVDPGEGAVLLQMDETQIADALDRALERVPGVKGVNNHMGSAFSENLEKMRVVLAFLKSHDLYYLDSRTSPRSVAIDLAGDLGLEAVSRNVFLDDDPSLPAVQTQMERLLSLARHNGSAVGIGHPHESTLQVLREFASRIRSEFEVVAVSELVKTR